MSWRKILPGTLLIVAACLLWAAPIVLIPKYRVVITSAPVARTTELMQFKVDVAGDYVVETVLPKGTTPFTMLNEVEVAKPGNPMFIGLTWTVYSHGKVVASGSSRQGTRPFSNDELAGQDIGSFHAEPLTPYIIQVRNDLISRTLMEARPRCGLCSHRSSRRGFRRSDDLPRCGPLLRIDRGGVADCCGGADGEEGWSGAGMRKLSAR